MSSLAEKLIALYPNALEDDWEVSWSITNGDTFVWKMQGVPSPTQQQIDAVTQVQINAGNVARRKRRILKKIDPLIAAIVKVMATKLNIPEQQLMQDIISEL